MRSADDVDGLTLVWFLRSWNLEERIALSFDGLTLVWFLRSWNRQY